MKIKNYVFLCICLLSPFPMWAEGITRHDLSLKDIMTVLDIRAFRYQIDIGKENADKFYYYIKCEKWNNGKIIDSIQVDAMGPDENGRDSLLVSYPEKENDVLLVAGEISGNEYRIKCPFPLKLIGSSMWLYNEKMKSEDLLKENGVILALRTDALGQGKPNGFDGVNDAFTYFNKIESPDGELIVFRLLLKKSNSNTDK